MLQMKYPSIPLRWFLEPKLFYRYALSSQNEALAPLCAGFSRSHRQSRREVLCGAYVRSLSNASTSTLSLSATFNKATFWTQTCKFAVKLTPRPWNPLRLPLNSTSWANSPFWPPHKQLLKHTSFQETYESSLPASCDDPLRSELLFNFLCLLSFLKESACFPQAFFWKKALPKKL